MDWILHKSNKLSCHTCLDEVLKPLNDHIESFNWILSDIDGGPHMSELPINYELDYFILSPAEFRKILDTKFQFYWGVILAVPVTYNIKIDESNLPFAEGNPYLFENGNIQYPDAEFEIDCFDSGYTIVKFKNKMLSERFKGFFDEASSLDSFNSKYFGKKTQL